MDISPALKALPKVELHEHLDGSLRVNTIVELANRDRVRLPASHAQELAALLSPGPSSLEVYLGAFAVTVAVLQNAPALRRVAREQVEDWHRDGVVYGEVRFAPELHTAAGLTRAAAVEAVLAGLEDGRREYPVETGLILCSMRHAPATLETARLVKAYQSDGVVAFDLAGSEAPHPPEEHRAAFEYCAEHLLAAICHAGEAAGPESIRSALVACRALRIGHGTRLIEEWGPDRGLPGVGSLTRYLLDRGILLEQCLSSNVQTRAVTALSEHPFDEFRRAGLKVALCTDNRLVSGTSLSRELALAQAQWGLTDTDLRNLQAGALDAAFCSAETKARIRAQHFARDADRKRV